MSSAIISYALVSQILVDFKTDRIRKQEIAVKTHISILKRDIFVNDLKERSSVSQMSLSGSGLFGHSQILPSSHFDAIDDYDC